MALNLVGGSKLPAEGVYYLNDFQLRGCNFERFRCKKDAKREPPSGSVPDSRAVPILAEVRQRSDRSDRSDSQGSGLFMC